MGSPQTTPRAEGSHPGQTFCPLCPNGGAWKATNQFYVRRSGQTHKKSTCAACRQKALVARLACACAEHFLVDTAAIDGPTRGVQAVARARHSLMLLLHETFGWSHNRIASALHRDRRTVSRGITQARGFLTASARLSILQGATQEQHRIAS
jgi:hypothetical protein